MKIYIILIVASLCACNQKEPECKAKLQGKWYYGEALLSYAEIKGDIWKEHLGEVDGEITYKIHFGKNCIEELEVIDFKLPFSVQKKGDRLKVDVQEIREDMFQYIMISPKGTPFCCYLLRDLNKPTKPGAPC